MPPRERPMAWSSPFFLRPGAVLMGADDGGVDHHVFGVGVAGQMIQNTLENSALAPPAEALVRALPGAKMRRQIPAMERLSDSGRAPRRRRADCLAQYRRHGPYDQEENP
jgi:hypothetical protein